VPRMLDTMTALRIEPLRLDGPDLWEPALAEPGLAEPGGGEPGFGGPGRESADQALGESVDQGSGSTGFAAVGRDPLSDPGRLGSRSPGPGQPGLGS
jgi:hypothetical protein